MALKIKPPRQIIADLGIQENGPMHAYFTQRCKDYMTRFVPMRDNFLRTIVDVQVNKIIYDSEYASYQYYGEREDGSHKIKHWTTPGTGPYWDKKMVTAYMPIIKKEVNEFVKKGIK